LVSCLSESGRRVEFSSGCTDVVDLWTALPQKEKMNECYKLLGERAADLLGMGLVPRDCEVVRVEASDCTPALGTKLVCTYECRAAVE
jgi:hypothetical protein